MNRNSNSRRVRWYAVLATALATLLGGLVVLTIIVPLQKAEKSANQSKQKLEGATFAAPCRHAFAQSLNLRAVDKNLQCSFQFYLGLHNRCAHVDFPHVCDVLLGNPPKAVVAAAKAEGRSLKGVIIGGGTSNPSGQPSPPSGGPPGPPSPPGDAIGQIVQQTTTQVCTTINQLGLRVPC